MNIFLQYLEAEDDVDTLVVVGVEILDDVDADDDVDTELDVVELKFKGFVIILKSVFSFCSIDKKGCLS